MEYGQRCEDTFRGEKVSELACEIDDFVYAVIEIESGQLNPDVDSRRA